MASSRHSGKNLSAPSAAASSADAGHEQPGEFLTTAQGLRLPDTDHSLKAGGRGPAHRAWTGHHRSSPPPTRPCSHPGNLADWRHA
jgi:hypothetical protein